MVRDTSASAIADQPTTSPIVEAMFWPSRKLPKARIAAVEIEPGRYVVGFRPDVFSRQDAAEFVRLLIGPFVDCTDEIEAACGRNGGAR